jgi:HAD superfamily hydrolase (TIGR01509 family)
MSIEALVFDMDGVLVDSEHVWEGVRRTFVLESLGQWHPDSQCRMMGMSTDEWSSFIAYDLGVDLAPSKIADVVITRIANEYRQRLSLLPGAEEAVRCVAGSWPLGLASSSPRRLIDVVLELTGLTDQFAVTISADEVTRGKPDPDIYLTVVLNLGADPANCVAIEDSSNGLRAAHAAGLRLIAVPRPDYPPEPDALAAADCVLDDLSQLTPALIADLGTRQ